MLSELILEGEINRLVKKNIVIYKQRRDCLIHHLGAVFKDRLHWEVPSGGLALWLQFRPQISLVKFAKEAERNQVFLPQTILYQNKNTCAVRFGYGHLNEAEIEAVMKQLKRAYDVVLNS